MKVQIERKSALFVGCVYMPIDSCSVAVVKNFYDMHKEDVLGFRENGTVLFLGDFNARVGSAVDRDDVVGMFWEDTLTGVDLSEQSKVT